MIDIPAPWALTLILSALFALPVAVLIVPPITEHLKHRRQPWQ